MQNTKKLLTWIVMVAIATMLVCGLSSTALAVEEGARGTETTEPTPTPSPTLPPEPIERDVTLVRVPQNKNFLPVPACITLNDIGYTGTETKLTIPETVITHDGDQEYINHIVAIGYNSYSQKDFHVASDATFADNQNLVSVTLPATLTKGVYERAFYNCDNLTTVNINANLMGSYIFADCDGLTAVELPEGLTNGGSGYTFQNCDNLVTVTWPTTITTIPTYAFAYCPMTSFEVPEGVTLIDDGAFYHSQLAEVTLPESLYTIGNSAFAYCGDLKNITLPSELRRIDDSAFSHCSLETIDVPDQVSLLGDYVFFNNTSLKTATLGTKVTQVGERCFANCHQLSSITFETESGVQLSDGAFANTAFVDGTCFTKVTKMGAGCFRDCQKMTSFDFPHVVDGSEIYYYTSGDQTRKSTRSWAKALPPSIFQGCSALQSVTLPNGLLEIRDYAFGDCVQLLGLNVPDTVTTFGTYIISGCTFDGAAFHFPANMSLLNRYSLAKWPGVTHITVPAKIVWLEEHVFDSDKNLVECTFLADYIRGGAYTFAYCDSLDGAGVHLPEYHDFSSTETYPNLTQGQRESFQGSNHSIPDHFFAFCSGLKTYDVPAHIKVVGENAFLSCKNLTTLNLPDGVGRLGRYMVAQCDSLRSVDLPQSLSQVDYYAFANWTGVQEVTFPPHITKIDSGGFYNCPNLVTVTLPETLTTVSDRAFSRCTGLKYVNFPAAITLDVETFSYCSTLEELHLPQIGDTLPTGLCKNDVQLKSITIPEGVKTIGSEAFRNCERLDNVILPSTTEIINSQAFDFCCTIRTITIPASVQLIQNRAFNGAHNLDKITFESHLGREIADRAFEGTHFMAKPGWSTGNPDFADNVDFEIVDGYLVRYRGVAETVVVPDGVTHICGGAFSENTTAKSIYLPDSVVSLGTKAFYNTKIEEIAIPSGVTIIPQECFAYCPKLQKCILPDTITAIEHGAFLYDKSLHITVPQSVQNIGYRVFMDCGSAVWPGGGGVYSRNEAYKDIY